MSWQDRFRRPSRPESNPDDDEHREDIDRETGEIPSRREESRAAPDASAATVQGERTIPSVNRERSIQSRVSASLALGAFVLLGGGFLFWYYSTQIARTHDAQVSAKKAKDERAGGETKVTGIGRVDPLASVKAVTPVVADSTLMAPPPPSPYGAPTGSPNAGPPPKTPEQLALERQLGMPVLRRASTGMGDSTSTASSAHGTLPPMPGAAMPGAVPGMSQLLGSLQMPGSLPSSASAGALGANLRPTPTPAVTAQTLPTRRLLLPKGAFIDCTLETAIDSTYEGMTTCIGASDIYGADGKVVLLERGTKYVGEQRGEPHQGQARVFVVWNEARTPTGVVVQLASPGTDELGRNGLPGFVDTHFWQRFGAAILVSVIDGTMQAIAASQQSGNRTGGGGGVVIGAQGGRDVMTEVLRSTISIPPTVVKNQGERIQILVARDVDFRTVYALRSDPATP
jgi:type IV secretion system protein VirB10